MLEILPRFIEFEKSISQGLPNTQRLQNHINTAKYCLRHFEQMYFTSPEHYYFLKLDSFYKQARTRKEFPKKMIYREFLENSLWYGYVDDYPVYTCLFFPKITDEDSLTSTFQLSLETHFFLKAQTFKLLTTEHDSSKETPINNITRSLRKLITTKVYQHLNTPEYQRVSNVCELYQFCTNLNTSKDHLISQEHLIDSSSFESGMVTDDEVRWINNATVILRNFFSSICKRPDKTRPSTSSDKDVSERATYNRKMGLVISKEAKDLHILIPIELEKPKGLLKKIQHKTPVLGEDVDQDILDEENSDDLDEETQTDDFMWNQSKPCELNNPIASLISGQRLLPHIALSNQLLRPRAIDSDIQAIFRLIKLTVGLINQGIKGLCPEHIKKTLRWLITLLTGRLVEQIELEEFFLNEKDIFTNEDATLIRIGFPQYMHRGNLGHKAVYIDSQTEDLELILPQEIIDLWKPLITALYDKHDPNSHINLKPETNKHRKIAKKNDSKPSSVLDQWDINEMRSQVQRSFSQLSSDSWLLSVFTWQTSGLANTQKHYASFPLKKAQAMFEAHIQSFLNIDTQPIPWSHRNNQRIGTPYYLNRRTFGLISTQLWQTAAPLFETLNYESCCLNELKFRFNSLAFWIDSYCGFVSASRNTIDPIIRAELVSEDGLYRINDKNRYDGFNTRMVYVPPDLLKRLQQYQKIRKKILIYLRKTQKLSQDEEKIITSNRLFFFKINKKKQIKIAKYTRSRCRDEIFTQTRTDTQLNLSPEQIAIFEYLRELKTNVNRHYLRGRLLELGMPGHFIDPLMGHWHSGTQPWGQMSIFNQSQYLKALKSTIPIVVKELNFEIKDAQT